MMSLVRCHLLALGLIFCASVPALAQMSSITPKGIGPNGGAPGITPVNTGPAPDTGILLGGWVLFPKLSAGGGYNDNVFAVENGAQDDFVYSVQPSLDLETTWTHYLLTFRAQYDLEHYARFTSENQDDYLFSGEFKFDVDAATQVDTNSEYARLTEARGNTNLSASAAKPVNYDRWYNSFDVSHEFNRLMVELDGTYTTLRFSNVPAIGGGTVIEVDRDRDVGTLAAEIGYEVSPDYTMFARGNIDERSYRLVSSQFRNSHGYQADVGVRLGLTNLIVGQAYIGYLQEDHRSPLGTVAGLDAGAQLDWSPTELWKVTLSGYRSVEETDELGATAYLASTAALLVTHSLTERVTLNAGVSYANDDYKGLTRNEDIVGATFGASYALTRNFSLTGDYQYTNRSSNLVGGSYSQNLVEARAQLAL